jgi:hypothetical protein
MLRFVPDFATGARRTGCRNGIAGIALEDPFLRYSHLHVELKEWSHVMYRILTENKNVDQIKEKLRVLSLDYPIFLGVGAWHEHEKFSLAIELLGYGFENSFHIAS